ncbi:uncharacterized protein LOC126715098 isoform X1 [Quercus robur]|uniref:uncharacterized protein LOC126715098 isoform X1 n=1 Tax=Quercus robur TaxID=38942 RepID=UPI0021633DD1|nr:uncharacterized protein LOC126715098 isoform X1 [Quercus robur]
MADSSPPRSRRTRSQLQSQSTMTKITELDVDSLAHCASYLDNLQDLSNLAMSCKYLKRVAYSNSIWLRWFREHWPQQVPSNPSQPLEVREAYLARRTALQKFKFFDPFVGDMLALHKPCNHILLEKNTFTFSQGPVIEMRKIDNFLRRMCYDLLILSEGTASITCMRSFPLNETSLFQSETQSEENVLVTASCDRSIRIWWEGSCHRRFRGHDGPVFTLSDKLLGHGNSKVLASGGEDGTVRLWSLKSVGKRGQSALKATLYGHESSVKLMSVAGHKTSLLVTLSRDSKVRVWDTTKSSSVDSSCCVGKASLSGSPVNVKCHESLLYVAAGSSVIAFDLRIMRKVLTAANHQPKLHSFEMLPSKSLICTGVGGRALLWDIRRNQETKPEPIVELGAHTGSVSFLHMDPYKIVTGGRKDFNINVWETDTGTQTNSLSCRSDDLPTTGSGCTALAVNGCRIVTACGGEGIGVVRFRDFKNATCPVVKFENEHASRFWDPQSYSDTDGSDDYTDSSDDYSDY